MKTQDELYGRTKFIPTFIESRSVTGKKLLDIGCGNGWFEKTIIERNPKSITGIDISAGAVAKAKAGFRREKGLEFFVNDAISLPFPDQSFDTVVSWDVIEHLPKNSELLFLTSIYRVLKKDGDLYLSTPNRSFLATIFDPAWWLIGHKHYHEKTLLEIGKTVGFLPVRSEVRGGVWEVLWLLNLYITKWILRRAPFALPLFMQKQNEEYESNHGIGTLFIHFKA